MSSYKNETRISTVGAVTDAITELQSLGEEAREIVDNAPEGLSQTDRITTFDETASTLESLDEPDVPPIIDGIAISYSERVNKNKRRGASRAARCSNAVALLEAAKTAAEDWLADLDERETGAEEGKDVAGAEHRDDVEEFISALSDIISEAENCEFPGMFG